MPAACAAAAAGCGRGGFPAKWHVPPITRRCAERPAPRTPAAWRAARGQRQRRAPPGRGAGGSGSRRHGARRLMQRHTRRLQRHGISPPCQQSKAHAVAAAAAPIPVLHLSTHVRSTHPACPRPSGSSSAQPGPAPQHPRVQHPSDLPQTPAAAAGTPQPPLSRSPAPPPPAGRNCRGSSAPGSGCACACRAGRGGGAEDEWGSQHVQVPRRCLQSVQSATAGACPQSSVRSPIAHLNQWCHLPQRP